MKLIAPDYYKKFVCIADKCVHNCCIGWEIDIDDDTYKYYKTVSGAIGKKLKSNISETDTTHFILDKNDRCPFLNQNNLCEIILDLGEDKLCDICSDHPRFRNFFTNRTEIGLGLCCEAAAKLIIKNKEKVLLINIGDSEENTKESSEEADFFVLRQKIFDIIQNRSVCIDKRISILIREFDIFVPDVLSDEVTEKYSELERLDTQWDNELNSLKILDNTDNDIFLSEEFEIAFEQLIIYFLFRHMADGLYNGNIKERIAFSILSSMTVKALCAAKAKLTGKITTDDLADYARRYSSEIEYSGENIDTLLNFLKSD